MAIQKVMRMRKSTNATTLNALVPRALYQAVRPRMTAFRV